MLANSNIRTRNHNIQTDRNRDNISAVSVRVFSWFGGVTIDGVWIGVLDFLTTYTHETASNYSVVANFHTS
jgi:hypothetical protein